MDGSHFTLAVAGKRQELTLPLPGTYNLYNALAAAALASGLGVNMAAMRSALAGSMAAFGRVEKLEVRGRTLYVLLIKNPAGFTQILDTFLLTQHQPHVLMAINDNFADGRDVSWLWDVPLEALADREPKVWTSGTRGGDMALRLHYAGVAAHPTVAIGEAIEQLIYHTPDGGMAFILPTYTAMLEVRQVLSQQADLQEVKQ